MYKKHGMSKTHLYNIWAMMRHRCYNPKNIGWKNYGGRGVGIAVEWLEYENFQNWANENGYRPGLSLDRIDTDGFYEPSNCKFITKQENSSKPKSYGDLLPYMKYFNITPVK